MHANHQRRCAALAAALSAGLLGDDDTPSAMFHVRLLWLVVTLWPPH
jgi:hypothetical protein